MAGHPDSRGVVEIAQYRTQARFLLAAVKEENTAPVQANLSLILRMISEVEMLFV